ncbi:MAG: hypothetical protein ABMA13_23145, partial [Chthoniobacteraceae bacterium]
MIARKSSSTARRSLGDILRSILSGSHAGCSHREQPLVEVLEHRVAPATLTLTGMSGGVHVFDIGSGDDFVLGNVGGKLIVTDSAHQVVWSHAGKILDLSIDAGGDDFTIAGKVRVADDFSITGTGEVKVGGTGVVRAGDQLSIRGGVVLVEGELFAGRGGFGGDILITGTKLSLEGDAKIGVAAKRGGGTVLIGGDYQGLNPAIENAKQVFVGPDVTINANATLRGDGGKVIVWADDAEYFAGKISARGGRLGGDGGFVETSSSVLTVIGRVDVSAPRGANGTWLIDPNNIRIGAGGDFNITSGAGFFDSAGDSAFLSVASLNAALDSGGSVVITTKTAGANTEAGDIEIWDTVTKSSGADSTLTLNAHRSVLFINDGDTDAPALISTNNKLNVIVSTNYDNDSSNGGFFMLYDSGNSIAATIDTNGGDLTVGGQNSPSTQPAIGPTDKGVFIEQATITTGAGNISIRGQGDAVSGGGASIGIDITSGASITTTSGNITLVGTGGAVSDAFTQGISIYSGSSITTATGAITITGTTSATGANAYGVKIQLNSKVEATGNGTISITGTGSASASGSASEGVALFDNADVLGGGSGDITITGTGGTSSHGFITGSGATDITVGGGSHTGAITIIANSMSLANAAIQTTTTATLRPNTNGTAVNLGSATGVGATLNLTDAELDLVSAGTLVIGNSNTGAFTISSSISRAAATAFTINSGANAVTFTGGSGIDAAGGNVTFNTGAITGSTGPDVTSSGATLVINASGAVTMATAVATLGTSSVTSGALTISNTGALGVTSATTTNGAISLTAVGGNLTVTSATAGGTARNITLTTTTSGNVLVGDVTAASDVVTITSAGSIEESGADAGADITAGSASLSAATGIGASGTIETDVTTLTSATTTGAAANIDLSDVAGGLSVTSATTTDGAITLNATGGDLTLTTVTAGGTGRNIAATTTTSGNVLVGNVTAASDVITITSAGSIEESGADGGSDITAGSASLSGATGIGASGTIEIDLTTLTSATTTGAAASIDLSDLASGL